jgi:hypothetical protein
MSTASAVPLLRDTDDEPRSGGRSINGGGAEADVVHSQHSNTTPASSSSTASRPSAAGFHAISIEDSEISSSTSSSNPNGKKPAGGVKAKKKERFGIGGAPPPADVPKSKKINFVRLLALSRPERGTLIWATVCLFLSSILNLALPAIVAVVIDAISTGSDADASRKESALYHALTAFGDAPRTILNVSTFLLLIIVIIANIFGCIRGYLFSLAGERIVARMRRDLFRKIVTFEVGFFDVTVSRERTTKGKAFVEDRDARRFEGGSVPARGRAREVDH